MIVLYEQPSAKGYNRRARKLANQYPDDAAIQDLAARALRGDGDARAAVWVRWMEHLRLRFEWGASCEAPKW